MKFINIYIVYSLGLLLMLGACQEDNFDVAFFDDYKDKPFNEVSFLMAHNAFASNAYNIGGILKNQDLDMPSQFEFGVRGVMMDVYYRESYPGAEQIFVCHGANCASNSGFRDEANPRAYVYYLSLIKTFLDDNPDAVMTIIMQDDEIPTEQFGLLNQQYIDAGLTDYIFYPNSAEWNVNELGSWPTIQWMIDQGKRLIVFANNPENSFHPLQWDYTVENDFGSVGFNSCPRRQESDPLDNTTKQLFLMNHFRSLLIGVDPTADNNYNKLLSKVDNFCRPAASRYPNYVAVDFVEKGKLGGALKVVNELNMRNDW